MANVSFKMGTNEKIELVPKKQGQILVSTDTQDLLVDTTDSNRIKIGGGLGETTSEGGEIFNLYKETTESLGGIGSQKLPANTAGKYAHAEGVSTTASGKGSHAEGAGTKAEAEGAHAEGAGTLVTGAGSHAEGRGINFSVKVTSIRDNVIFVTSNNSSITLQASELEAIKKNAVIFYKANDSHDGVFYYATAVELEKFLGVATACKITLDKTPIFNTDANLTVIMGGALSYISHIEGNYNNTVDIEATNLYSNDNAKHQRQHAEGSRTLSMGYASHSEGEYTVASGDMSHAEGKDTSAIGNNAHSEGDSTKAIASASHAEGSWTVANGYGSHVEGFQTETGENANYAHAEGRGTKAHGANSHAGGLATIASNENSTAIGKHNFPTIVRNLTFTIDEKTTRDHLTIIIGNFSENSNATAKLSFFNPRLTYNGKDIINPMTSEFFNTSENGSWTKKGTVTTDARNDGYIVFDNVAKNSWARVEYTQTGMVLEPGTYTLSVMYYVLNGDIQSLVDQNIFVMRVNFAGVNISSNGTYEEIKTLFNVGNANNDSNRSNAFEVYADGHAEIQTVGNTDNSVVTKSYVDNAIEFKEIKGTFFREDGKYTTGTHI